jgi:hypothetical protein
MERTTVLGMMLAPSAASVSLVVRLVMELVFLLLAAPLLRPPSRPQLLMVTTPQRW